MPRWIETDTLTDHDISSAHEVGSYTSDADRLILAQVFIDTAAGNGDYVFYATLQIAGAGSAYVLIPKTTAAAASGETAIGAQSIFVAVKDDDVLKVYVDALAGDTSVDVYCRFFEMAALRPTTADRTLDVSSTGEAGLDFDNVKVATGATTLTNITVPTVTTTATASAVTAISAGGIASTSFAAGAIDAAAIAAGAIDNATFAADVGSTAYATNIIALAADKAIVNAALATATELGKVPKSDSNVSWNATALAAINAEVDGALNTAIPGSPTADSINERIVAIDAYGAPPAAATIASAVLDEAKGAHAGHLASIPTNPYTGTPPSTADIKTALEADGSKLDHLWEMTADDGGVRQLTANALELAPSGSGLTAQQTRDAMKLAPTAGDPAAGSVDKHLSDILEDTAALAAGYTGSVPWTYTLTSTDNVTPIPQARIEVYSDEAQASRVAAGYTDNFGQVTFYLDPGTYYLRRTKAGWQFTNPDTEIVV